MKRDVFVSIAIATAIAFCTIVLTILFIGPGGILPKHISLLGIKLDIGDLSSTITTLSIPATILVFVLVLTVFAIIMVTRRLQRLIWQTVGTVPLSDRLRSEICEGLQAQKVRIAFQTSWPMHPSTALPAPIPRRVDFGDAQFSVQPSDLRRIRTFLSHAPRRGRIQTLQENVLMITGEPGAGKSILSQEIHSSLVEGVSLGYHSLIPLVLFASDITLKSIGVDGVPFSLKQIIINYLNSQGSTNYIKLSEFISNHWEECDFLLFIDGLDEISQRSEYENIQRALKKVIDAELNFPHRRIRKFIISCRVEDNIGIFVDAINVTLRGLRTERERIRFCDNLINSHNLSSASKAMIRSALSLTSTNLSSVDIYRRNPYFLSLLFNYYESRAGRGVDKHIDFRFLMDSYITREIERPVAYVNVKASQFPAEARRTLRQDIEQVATAYLQSIAYIMTRDTEEGALYGQIGVNKGLLQNFIDSVSIRNGKGICNRWHYISLLLDRLTSDEPMTEQEIGAFAKRADLRDNDIRILDVIARDMKHISFADLDISYRNEFVMRCFSTIPYEGRLETDKWYQKLAYYIANEAKDIASGLRSILCLAIFSRGLVSAHLLRLIYIEYSSSVPSIRFRHRRLAEYHAACYFNERWIELMPLPRTPWLTPVFNLVCAIEGEGCKALEWFTAQLDPVPANNAFEWRSALVAAGEAAAFASRGKKYYDIMSKMVSRLIQLLSRPQSSDINTSQNSSNLAVTEFSVIGVLEFISSLNGLSLHIRPQIIDRFIKSQLSKPPYFLIYSAQAIYSVGKMVRGVPRFRFAIIALADAARSPASIFDKPVESFRYGLGIQWLIIATLLLFIEVTGEFVAAFGVVFILTSVGASGVSIEELAAIRLWGGTVLFVILAAIRILKLIRSPSDTIVVTSVPLRVVMFVIDSVMILSKMIYRVLLNIPNNISKVINKVMEVWSWKVYSYFYLARNFSTKFTRAEVSKVLNGVRAEGIEVAVGFGRALWVFICSILKVSLWVGGFGSICIVLLAVIAPGSDTTGGRQAIAPGSDTTGGRQAGDTVFGRIGGIRESNSAGVKPDGGSRGASGSPDGQQREPVLHSKEADHSPPGISNKGDGEILQGNTEGRQPEAKHLDPLPSQTCDDVYALRDDIFLMWSPDRRMSVDEIFATRSNISIKVKALIEMNEKFKCPLDVSGPIGYSLQDEVVDELLSVDSTLMPLPLNDSALFDGNMFTRLEELSKSSFPHNNGSGILAEMSSFAYYYFDIGHAIAELDQLINLAERARRVGRVTPLKTGAYPEKSEYVAFANKLAEVISDARVNEEALKIRREEIGAGFKHALAYATVLPGFVGGAIWLAIVYTAINRDKALLRRFSRSDVKDMCSALCDENVSDFVRGRLAISIVEREDADMGTIALLESVVEVLDRSKPREMKFALELTSIIVNLSSRLTHRGN